MSFLLHNSITLHMVEGSPLATHMILDKLKQDVRVVIPAHWGKSQWLTTLILSLNTACVNGRIAPPPIILFLTSGEDLERFKNLCRALGLCFPVHFLLIRDELLKEQAFPFAIQHLDAGAGGAMAVFKKIAGLHLISSHDEIDYYNICIDADSLFMNWNSEIVDGIAHNYNKNIYPGSLVEQDSIFNQINVISARMSSPDSAHKEFIDKYGLIYNWFFDIPVYKTSDYKRFMQHQARIHGGVDQFLSKTTWCGFEHTLFMYFRVQNGGTIICYEENPIPEGLSVEDVFRINARFGLVPLWINSAAYFAAPRRNSDRETFCLLSHFDRWGLEG